MKNKKIIIAGGTGFIGQALAAYFGKENKVIILTRADAKSLKNRNGVHLLSAGDGYNIHYWRWNAERPEAHWAPEIDGCDLVINLTGKSVNCLYTKKNKQEILDSRVHSTLLLGRIIRNATRPPKIWINASSATIYQHNPSSAQNEISGEIQIEKKRDAYFSSYDRFSKFCCKLVGKITAFFHPDLITAKTDFSVDVCTKWEKAFFGIRTPFTRKIALRMAITLGNGGVFTECRKLAKAGLGGYHGNGTQKFSWVHLEDVCRAISWIADHEEMEGVYNLASPGTVTNRQFMQTLRNSLGIKSGIPLPVFLLKIGALLRKTETELLLKSRWVEAGKLADSGFVFQYPQLKTALKQLCKSTNAT